MKYTALVLMVLSSACATTYERCNEFVENPYGLSMDMTQEEIKAKFPGESDDAIAAKIKAKTKMEWQRYGSIEACVNRKTAQDNYNWSQVASIGDTVNAAHQGSPRVVSTRTVTPVYDVHKDAVCREACSAMDNEFSCFQVCMR